MDMRYRPVSSAPGTQLWLKCPDDNDWWPAIVCDPSECDQELLLFVDPNENTCVRLYHDPSNLYFVNVNDSASCRPLHWNLQEQDESEVLWYRNPRKERHLDKAWQDHTIAVMAQSSNSRDAEQQQPAQQQEQAQSTQARHSSEIESYSSHDLRKIGRLLKAIDGPSAALIQQHLEEDGITQADIDNSRREKRRERRKSKRRRMEEGNNEGASDADSANASNEQESRVQPLFQPSSVEPLTIAIAPLEAPNGAPQAIAATAMTEGIDDEFVDDTQAWDEHSLDVLRREVFENKQKCALDPVYKFVEVLGAVTVDSKPIAVAMHGPKSIFKEFEESSFAVLLVALSSSYDHTHGWMEDIEWDGTTIRMTLMINGAPVAAPRNWRLAARRQNASRTAVPIDITSAIGQNEFFSLRVALPRDLDMELWSGVITAVLVQKRSISDVCQALEATYVSPSAARRVAGGGAVESTSAVVSLTCPLSMAMLTVPCRGRHCEHAQSFELSAFLTQCCSTHVWICPVCDASLYPSDIIVDFALIAFLKSNKRHLEDMDGLTITAQGSILPRLRSARKSQAAPTVVDEDD